MEEATFSKMSINIQKKTRRHSPENRNLSVQSRENFKPYVLAYYLYSATPLKTRTIHENSPKRLSEKFLLGFQ